MNICQNILHRRKKCTEVWISMNNSFYFWIDYLFKITENWVVTVVLDYCGRTIIIIQLLI